jgi:hypothetical protein
MVNNFDFQELAGADQIPGGLDVGIAWGRVATGVVMLCGAPVYVEPERCGPENSLIYCGKHLRQST